jgi:hypothetical protein
MELKDLADLFQLLHAVELPEGEKPKPDDDIFGFQWEEEFIILAEEKELVETIEVQPDACLDYPLRLWFPDQASTEGVLAIMLTSKGKDALEAYKLRLEQLRAAFRL